MALRRLSIKTLFISFFLILTLFYSQGAQAAKIDNLEFLASLDNLGKLSVNQSISYDFEDSQSALVELFIPQKYRLADQSFKLHITDIVVRDSAGNALTFETKARGDNLVLTVSGGQRFFSGLVTFRLQYQASGLVNYDLNQDLFYWDLTGQAWPLRIKRSQLQLSLPKKIALDNSQLVCLSGPLDKALKCRASVVDNSTDEAVLIFDNTFELLSGESHRVSFNLPKGFIYEPSWRELIVNFLIKHRFVFLALLSLVFIVFISRFIAKNLNINRDSDLQSAPPSGLTPAELSLLLDGSVSHQALIAEILHLAIRGYLKITRVFNGVSDDYQLTQLQDPRTAVSDYQQSLLSAIFASSSELSLLSVGSSLSANFNLINDQLHHSLADKGHLVKNILRVKVICLLIGLLVMVAGSLFVTVQLQAQFWGLVLAAGLGIVMIAGALLLPHSTKQGRVCRRKILAFRSFLVSVSEKSNQKNQVQFETYLPYSLVLGVEQDWAYQYKGVFLSPATWLSDSTILENYNSLLLVDTIDSFARSCHEYLFN
jgi:hypothetical protein